MTCVYFSFCLFAVEDLDGEEDDDDDDGKTWGGCGGGQHIDPDP